MEEKRQDGAQESSEFMKHDVVGSLAEALGSREDVLYVCADRGVSDANTQQVIARYEELIQLQPTTEIRRESGSL